MDKQGKLCILVKSDRHFDLVEQLTEAAFQQKRQIKIHILGAGLALLCSNPFTRLAEMAKISICTDSIENYHAKINSTIPESVRIVPPEQISKIIEWGDRSVIF